MEEAGLDLGFVLVVIGNLLFHHYTYMIIVYIEGIQSKDSCFIEPNLKYIFCMGCL